MNKVLIRYRVYFIANIKLSEIIKYKCLIS